MSLINLNSVRRNRGRGSVGHHRGEPDQLRDLGPGLGPVERQGPGREDDEAEDVESAADGERDQAARAERAEEGPRGGRGLGGRGGEGGQGASVQEPGNVWN